MLLLVVVVVAECVVSRRLRSKTYRRVCECGWRNETARIIIRCGRLLYQSILIRPSTRQPTKTLPPPEPMGDAARCVLSDASARSERCARVPFLKWWPNLATLSGILKCSSQKTSSSQALLEKFNDIFIGTELKVFVKDML